MWAPAVRFTAEEQKNLVALPALESLAHRQGRIETDSHKQGTESELVEPHR